MTCVFLFSHHEILHSLFKYALFYAEKNAFLFFIFLGMIKKLSHLIKILQYLFYWCGTLIHSQLYCIDSILFTIFLFLIWILYFVSPLHQRMSVCWCKIFNVELQSLSDVSLFCSADYPFIWPQRILQNSLINGVFKTCWVCVHVLEREELITKICSLKKGQWMKVPNPVTKSRII